MNELCIRSMLYAYANYALKHFSNTTYNPSSPHEATCILSEEHAGLSFPLNALHCSADDVPGILR